MNRTDLTALAANFSGELVRVTYTDGTELVVVANGNVNSKGLVVRHHADEPVFYIAPTKIASVDQATADKDDTKDVTDEDIYAMLEDGMTTADLATVLSDHLKISLEPKELRVHLRALGLGVGKGRKYSLSATEFRMVRDLISAPAN